MKRPNKESGLLPLVYYIYIFLSSAIIVFVVVDRLMDWKIISGGPPGKKTISYSYIDGMLTMSGHTDDKVVALAFLRSYNPGEIERTADLLSGLKAHATYFVYGSQAHSVANELQYVESMGHSIGYTVNNPGQIARFENKGAARNNIGLSFKNISRILNHEVIWFMPDWKGFELYGVEAAQDLNSNVSLWTFDDRDPEYAHGIPVLRLKKGDIIRLSRPWPVESLENLINSIQTEGFRIITVHELNDLSEKGGQFD